MLDDKLIEESCTNADYEAINSHEFVSQSNQETENIKEDTFFSKFKSIFRTNE